MYIEMIWMEICVYFALRNLMILKNAKCCKNRDFGWVVSIFRPTSWLLFFATDAFQKQLPRGVMFRITPETLLEIGSHQGCLFSWESSEIFCNSFSKLVNNSFWTFPQFPSKSTILKIFVKFTRKNIRWSPLFSKVAGQHSKKLMCSLKSPLFVDMWLLWWHV